MARLAVVVSVAIVLAAGSWAAPQDAPPQVFRSTADIVPLFVTVVEKSGRLATGLTKEAFQVFDNGKPQPIAVFSNAPQPIRVIILLDVSGSMAGNGPLLGRAASELAARLGPGDLARIGIFGNEISISPTFTRDARALALMRTICRPTQARCGKPWNRPSASLRR
jgi:Ca-activated chloride channel family protein